MPVNLATKTADHDERKRLEKVSLLLERAHHLLQPADDKAPDPYACIRGSLSDLMADIAAEQDDLTGTIGDEIDWKGRGAAA